MTTKETTTHTEQGKVQDLQPTGIGSLDEILNGGIPYKNIVLLAGNPGSCKTTLAAQWLFAGREHYDERGVYIALTESVATLKHNLQTFSFYHEEYLPYDLHFTDLRGIAASLELGEKLHLEEKDVEAIIDVILNIVQKTHAKRVVIDSVNALLWPLKDVGMVRAFITRIGARLREEGVTAMLISEAPKDGYSAFGVEEFVADGIIKLNYLPGEQGSIRRLEVIKMRGSTFRSGSVIFDVDSSGVAIYPKIPIDRSVAKTNFTTRKSTGVAALDEMMMGGVPEGHMMLIAGNTGTGKTTFSIEFLRNGFKQGEAGIFVALEESRDQVKKTALAHGFDFEQYENDKLLTFINPSLIDVNPDKLLYKIIRTAKVTGATRIVVDSASSLETATLDKDSVREFLLQLLVYAKHNGITCYLTYLNDELFGATTGNLLGSGASSALRLSSIVDGIILLRYIERDQKVKKLINVLKLRGSDHDKKIREFKVTQSGIEIGKAVDAA